MWTLCMLVFSLVLVIIFYAVPIPSVRAPPRLIAVRQHDVLAQENNLSISEFVIGGLIGEGRFGNTYGCYQPNVPNSMIAIRVLDNNPDVEEYLTADINEQADFENQSVLRFFRFFYEGTRLYLLLEQPSMLLESQVDMSRLKVLEHVLHLIYAVQDARQAGIILRRISIEKLFIDLHGMVTIPDFGWRLLEDRVVHDEIVDVADIKVVATFLISKLESEWPLASSFLTEEHSSLEAMLNHPWCREDRTQLD